MLRYIKRNDAHTTFPRPADMHPALYELLTHRGIASAEEAERFLHPGERDLHDPFLLNDMGTAVEIIRQAMANRDPICVYGDYDVDGISASAIVRLWLESQGADVKVYIPHRHTEGYGLNEDAVRGIAGWAKLLITVDCGVTSVEHVALAKSLGLRVIVTDHHRPGKALPDCPVVDPLLNNYPFPWLCGAGVAWKLVWALSGAIPMDLIDLAALATVADIVSLTGENRAIVAMGLKAINARPRLGIAALIKAMEKRKAPDDPNEPDQTLSAEEVVAWIEAGGRPENPVTSRTIGFQLGPRLNAAGRLDSAMLAHELVTTDDPVRAAELAVKLSQLNARRQTEEKQIVEAAEARLEGFDFIAHRAIILAGEDWNSGVIGLAASKLAEKYHYPVIVLTAQGDVLHGSCRTIEGVDIFEALSGCAEHLVRFGGHTKAAGLTLRPEKLQDFIDAMDAWLSAHIAPEVYIPVALYDREVELDAVDEDLVDALAAMEPTGEGNPPAMYRARARVREAAAIGKAKDHLRLTVAGNGCTLSAVAWRYGYLADELREGAAVDMLFVPEVNVFRNEAEIRAKVEKLLFADAQAQIASNLGEESSLQCDFLTEIIYNKKISLSNPPKAVSIGRYTLKEWLAESPQGTLMLAGDFASAAIAAELGSCDVFIGRLPDDPRAFNAVCVCPRPGTVPSSYRRAVLLGCPAEWIDWDGDLYRADTIPEWTRAIPDIDGMRDAYRALKDLCSRPAGFSTRAQLAQLVADQAQTKRLTALLSMLVLEDLGLFAYDFDARPARVTRLDRRKADPEASAVWKALQRWRAEL